MADSSSEEKTEKPSAQKLRKARQEGQIPRSKDMGLAASLFAAFMVISSSFHWYEDFVRESFISVHQYAQNINDPDIIGQFLEHHLLILAKFILTLLPMPVAALFASLIPGGWLFLPKKILPDFSKLSPLKGIGRLFSTDHLVDTGKMTLKAMVLLVMLWISVRNNVAAFLGLQELYFKQAVSDGLALYSSIMRNFVILFIFFALIDVPLAKKMFTKGLKMTKQEVKDEFKNTEGNPEIKGRQRQRMREASRRRMMQDVPKADVVITNPTHFAVAIKYDAETSKAPVVLAKGEDYLAQKIKEAAREHHIEIVENKPLARMLYANVDIGQEIPPELYQAVAEILAMVYNMREK